MRNVSTASKQSGPNIRRMITAFLAASTIVISQTAQACTSFVIRTTDNSAVYARTMEFGFPMESRALVIPRNYKLTATGTGGKPSMSWTGKYAAVGMNALGAAALVDGMNEKGLVGGILYFPGFAGYADPAKVDPAKSLAPWEILTWALTSFATVAEVKAALGDIAVVNIVEETMKITPPVHYTLHDATGASLVIEPVDGKLKIYDNPLGVMTNSPSFDWHMTNLRNYLKLSPVNAEPLKIGAETFAPLGQGSGMLGIPGDPTPPSRFLRALGYTLSIEKKPSGPESVRLAEHIINNFDIPKGWVRDKNQGSEPLEYTQWSTVADLANLVYYVKTYDDPVLRGIDLKSFDLDAKGLVSAPLTPAMTPPALAFPKP